MRKINLTIFALIVTLLAFSVNADLLINSDTEIYVGSDNESDNDSLLVVDGNLEINGEVREGSTVELSNGETATISITPQAARERASSNMNVDYCDERNDCEIELKEKNINGETQLVYEIEAEKPAKLFGFIRTHIKTETDVNAETGTVIRSSKSWWSFMATSDTNVNIN